VRECGVERVVGELRSRPADDHDVHSGLIERHKVHAREVVADVAAVQQRAAGARVMLGQVCRGDRGRGVHVVDGDREALVRERGGDPAAGTRGRVGHQRERDVQPPERVDGARHRLPGHREHPVDVDQHRGDHGAHRS
jgi:hypothetical protein